MCEENFSFKVFILGERKTLASTVRNILKRGNHQTVLDF